MLTEDVKVRYGILGIIWLQFLWELYLSIRQHRLSKKTQEVPLELKNVMTQETFDKARHYALDKSTFEIISETFSIIILTLVIYNGYFYYFWTLASDISIWKNEVACSCIWMLLLNTINTITSLPFSIYYTFVLEEKYGFNKQTAKFFVIDKLKQFILTQVLVIPVAAFAIYIVKVGGDYFFIWLWLMTGIVVLFFVSILPAYIAPLFDKFTPLPEGELRTSIETLASQLEFPLGELFVVEGSKRSAHSNAYFTGIFVKRIVLYDTLLANEESGGCDNNEILAILSHELGHWKLGHVLKRLILIEVNLLLLFTAFAIMFNYSPLYKALGFPVDLKPILIGLIVILQYVMAPYNAILTVLSTMMSRYQEFQADEFGKSLGRSEYLIKALVKLNKDNLGFPIYDSLYSTWHLSHPPLLERISALKMKSE